MREESDRPARESGHPVVPTAQSAPGELRRVKDPSRPTVPTAKSVPEAPYGGEESGRPVVPAAQSAPRESTYRETGCTRPRCS